jgi:hypothetical protein
LLNGSPVRCKNHRWRSPATKRHGAALQKAPHRLPCDPWSVWPCAFCRSHDVHISSKLPMRPRALPVAPPCRDGYGRRQSARTNQPRQGRTRGRKACVACVGSLP